MTKAVVYQERVFSIHRLAAANYGCAASSYIPAIPEGVDIVIIDGAIGPFLKVCVTIHKQHVLAIFFMDQRVSSLLLFYIAIGFEK